jgi:hypothetical protein
MDALLSFQDQAGTPYWPESGITHLAVFRHNSAALSAIGPVPSRHKSSVI